MPQYVNKFLFWQKKFGPAQNILEPVKGQGINALKFLGWLKKFGLAQNILGPVKGQGNGLLGSLHLKNWTVSNKF
jgi:hypothetical protein